MVIHLSLLVQWTTLKTESPFGIIITFHTTIFDTKDCRWKTHIIWDKWDIEDTELQLHRENIPDIPDVTKGSSFLLCYSSCPPCFTEGDPWLTSAHTNVIFSWGHMPPALWTSVKLQVTRVALWRSNQHFILEASGLDNSFIASEYTLKNKARVLREALNRHRNRIPIFHLFSNCLGGILEMSIRSFLGNHKQVFFNLYK